MSLGIDISSTGGATTPGILKVSNEIARLALTPSAGDWVVQVDDGSLWYYDGADWQLRSLEDPLLRVEDSQSIQLTTTVANPPYDDDAKGHDVKFYATLRISPAAADVDNQKVEIDVQPDGVRTQIPDSSIRSVISATTPVAYDNLTGVISMAQATNANDGYMDSTHVAALEGVISDLNAHLSDTTDAHDASAISATGTYSDVQSAIDNFEADIAANNTAINDHIIDAVAAHAASAVSYSNATSGLVASNVQTAIDALDSIVDAHIADVTDAHAASAITFTPPTNYTSTTVQEAIAEFGSYKELAVLNIPSGGTITLAAIKRTALRIQGSGGPATGVLINHNNLANGDEVILFGNNATNYVELAPNTTVKFNGYPLLSQYDTIHMVKIASYLVEVARSM